MSSKRLLIAAIIGGGLGLGGVIGFVIGDSIANLGTDHRSNCISPERERYGLCSSSELVAADDLKWRGGVIALTSGIVAASGAGLLLVSGMIAYRLRAINRPSNRPGSSGEVEVPMAQLRLRLARGEISSDEFERLRQLIVDTRDR